jgi:LysM repeat protein
MPSSGHDPDGLPPSAWYLIGLGLLVGFVAVSLLAVSLLNGEGEDPGAAQAAEARSAKLPPVWVVHAGQTYSVIAAKTGLTVDQLETFNPKTNPATIVPGQRIKLRLHLPKPKPAPLGPRFWEVRRGQSFGSIAAATGRSLASLRRLNPKVKAAELQPGDRVRLRR